jgi:hypothetical protein
MIPRRAFCRRLDGMSGPGAYRAVPLGGQYMGLEFLQVGGGIGGDSVGVSMLG